MSPGLPPLADWIAAAATLPVWSLPAAFAAVSALVLLARLGRGQARLALSLEALARAREDGEARAAAALERRLAEVERSMADTLHGSVTRTAQSLGALGERLTGVDRAQARIERLSGEVLSLKDILANRHARGAFGEVQLAEILGNALPPDAFTLQATLANGRRADCLLHLPEPPGPLVIDAKFPLEGWEALRRAKPGVEAEAAARLFRGSVRAHLRAIAERYIIEGETAESAVMFLPSEAVFAELHASFPEVVREGFALRVWIVSPTTCMAVLTTLRAVLRDHRMLAAAAELRQELGLLARDLGTLGGHAAHLDRHLAQGAADLAALRASASRAAARAARIGTLDFGPGQTGAVPPGP